MSEEPNTEPDTEATVRAILDGWTDLTIEQHGSGENGFWRVVGLYQDNPLQPAKPYGGTRGDTAARDPATLAWTEADDDGSVGVVGLAWDLRVAAEADAVRSRAFMGIPEESASREMPAPETDALWSPEEEAPDLGAELLEVQDEEGQDSGDESASDPPQSEDHAEAVELATQEALGGGDEIQRVESEIPPTDASGADELRDAYPGVAILPDDLSIALALVIEAVAAEEETRVAAVEALQAIDLQAMSDYGNWPAGVAMDPNVEAGAKRFMAYAQQRTAIQSHSLALRRSARDHRARGDLSALQAMSDGVAVGWP